MLTATKLLGMLLMPLGLIWLGLLGATWWAFHRRLRGLGWLLLLVTTGFTAAGNLQLGHGLMVQLERQLPAFPEDAPPLEALFVLGGGSEVTEAGRPILGPSGDRIAEAARLWHAGRVQRLVASGASSDRAGSRRDLGAETRTLWLGLGVPAAAITVLDEPCFITRQEIQAYARLRERQGWRRVGLLSSAWHLPRALGLAQRAGLGVVPLPADHRGRVPRWQLWHLVPQQEGFQNSQLACWEWLGRRVGR